MSDMSIGYIRGKNMPCVKDDARMHRRRKRKSLMLFAKPVAPAARSEMIVFKENSIPDIRIKLL